MGDGVQLRGGYTPPMIDVHPNYMRYAPARDFNPNYVGGRFFANPEDDPAFDRSPRSRVAGFLPDSWEDYKHYHGYR